MASPESAALKLRQTSSSIRIVDPIDYPDWDDLLLQSRNGSFFHSSGWARVLRDTYGYKPVYFVERDNGCLSMLMPFMEVKSLLTGTRGVSLPFSDFSYLNLNQTNFKRVFDVAIDHGRSAGWKYMEWRGGEKYFGSFPHWTEYYQHSINLQKSEEDLLASFRKSTRRSLRKALKNDVNVEISNSECAMQDFYRLNCITRKHHGLPPQPFKFFKNLHGQIIRRKRGMIILGFHKKRILAGAVFVHFGNQAIYKYGASDRTLQHLRPNNLIFWEAIKWYSRNGYETLNLGRTDISNSGLLQFKRGWGGIESPLIYYRFRLSENSFTQKNDQNSVFYRCFKKMPISFSKMVGQLLYRHVG